jgi:hypothetical protein
MGKKSKLKTQRKLAKSSAQDLANFYLNAKNTEARQFRYQLVEEFLGKMTVACTPTGAPIPMIDVLRFVQPSFAFAYLDLIGHSVIGSRHKDFWPEIANALLTITVGIDNEEALKDWGVSVGEVTLVDEIVAKGFCYSGLQKIAERLDPVKICSLRTEILRNGSNNVYCDAIPTHLVASSCVAKKQIVHQSGSLILCYAGNYADNVATWNFEDKELWIVKKRCDGIYTTSAEARDGTLKVSEVRDMRQFLQNYKGPQMKGRLCPWKRQDGEENRPRALNRAPFFLPAANVASTT